jgi:hypothetical protein
VNKLGNNQQFGEDMKKSFLMAVAAGAALSLAGVSTANAALGTSWIRYSIDNGANWTSVQDNDGNDTSATTGVINYAFSAGGYSISIVSTITKPFGGITPAQPFMDLQVQGVHDIAAGAGGLIVEFSDIDWTPVPTGAFQSKIVVNNAGITAAQNNRAGANTAFDAPGFVLATIPAQTFGNGSQTTPVPGGLTAPYSLTLSTVFSSAGGFGTISTDASISAVPEGGNTLMLLGAALAGLAFFARSRKATA